jgi:hypothetical protein
MPTPYLKKLSTEMNIPLETLEQKWDEAKDKSSDPDNYALITTIFKRMIGIKESKLESFFSMIKSYRGNSKWD